MVLDSRRDGSIERRKSSVITCMSSRSARDCLLQDLDVFSVSKFDRGRYKGDSGMTASKG